MRILYAKKKTPPAGISNAARGNGQRSTRGLPSPHAAFESSQAESLNALLSVNSFFGVFMLPTFDGIHALNTVYASVSHRFTAADMRTAKFASGLQKYLDAQKQNR